MIETDPPSNGTAESEENVDSSDETNEGWSIRMKYAEPTLFFTVMSGTIFGVIATNIVEVQYCRAVLGIYDEDACLNTTAPYFSEVQKYTSSYTMFQTISLSILPALTSIFLGPWSDIFGRRPLMLSGSFGFLVTVILWTWGSITDLHPNYFLMFDLPLSLSGGGVVLQLAVFCYVCDISTTETRAFRLGILMGFLFIASLIGTLVTPYLQAISYPFTLAVCVGISSISFFYILFLLKESVSTTQTQRDLTSGNPFQWSFMKSIYDTCYTKQSSRNVQIFFCIGFLGFLSTVQTGGEGAVFYLFLQKVRHWTLVEFTHLMSLCTLVSAAASTLGTSKLLNLQDLEIVSIVNVIRLLCALVFFVGTQKWLVYITATLSSISGIYGAVLRSFLSKIVHADDVGKIFASFAMVDALSPLVSSPLYNTVYRETIDTYPKTVFLVSAWICLLLILVTALIVYLHHRPTTTSQLGTSTTTLTSSPERVVA